MRILWITLICCVCIASTTIKASKTRSNEIQGSSDIYIDLINRFDDNNTFYVDLYFSESYHDDERNALILTAEEEIFSDDNMTRKLVPERVKSLFQLKGLSVITIYNKKNEKLTTGKYSHIEYVQDLIEDKFVAVFDVVDTDIEGFTFCVGGIKKDLSPITYSEYEDETLKASLITHLKKSGTVWNTKHYKLDQIIYSIISIDAAAYIVETNGKSHKTLYTSKYTEAISNLTIISKNVSGKPLFLVECGQPETDMMWTAVLAFNGTQYQYAKDHLVKD